MTLPCFANKAVLFFFLILLFFFFFYKEYRTISGLNPSSLHVINARLMTNIKKKKLTSFHNLKHNEDFML